MCLCLSASERVKTCDAVLHDEWVRRRGTQVPAITVRAEILLACSEAVRTLFFDHIWQICSLLLLCVFVNVTTGDCEAVFE